MKTKTGYTLKKTIGATAASAALLLSLAACAAEETESVDAGEDTSPSTSTSTEPQTLIAAIGGEPDQLDPHITSAYFSFQVLENVFDTLVEPDENLVMQPALAESWTVSDDLLTWTFDLREGVTFHDGSEFTADDVVYSYNRIIDEALTPSWRFASVTDVVAVDDLTVEIQVSAPTPNLLAAIGGYKGMSIVSQENVESGDIVSNPIGTGPFAIESYNAADSIVLTANENYWGGAPAVDGLEFRFISEGSTALTALRNGEIHWTDSIPPQNVSDLASEDGVELGQVGSSDYWYLALNMNRTPWDDVRVRQAVAYALDREAITTAALLGNASVNQTAIPAASDWASDYAPYSLDLAKAQSLMDEAGVDSAEMELMVSSDYPETVTAAQVISAQLAEIGITVSITTLDFSTWLDGQANGDFDMLMMGWLGNIDPDDFSYAQHHSTGWANAQGYSNSEVDQLLDAGRTSTDEAERKGLYDQAAQIIVDEVSYLYLYNPDVVQAWSDSVEGYVARGDQAIRFRDVSISE